MSLKKVTGAECAEYVNKPVGFCSLTTYNAEAFKSLVEGIADPRENALNTIVKDNIYSGQDCDTGSWRYEPLICKFNHDTSRRVVALLLDKYDDGGYKVAILGNEYLDQRPTQGNRNCEGYHYELGIRVTQKYSTNLDFTMDADGAIPSYPEIVNTLSATGTTSFWTSLKGYNRAHRDVSATYEEMIDFTADIEGCDINYPNNCLSSEYQLLTDDPENTVIFGDGVEDSLYMNGDLIGDPLQYLQGNLYDLAVSRGLKIATLIPSHFEDSSAWHNYEVNTGQLMGSYNMSCVPYNIIITESLSFARNYLERGTIPPDAFLFPLDWENLPKYESDPDNPDDPSPNPPDEPDDNTPNDDTDDIDDNPPIAPTNTPAMFTNYNWYWLSIGDYMAFINWFWNDIGQFNDFDDIIAKVKGLYNDLASAVIMIRYMPVNVAFLGGQGDQKPLKIGMIQKATGSYDTLAMNKPPIVEIGSIDIARKYNSFLDLAPYSQLSLYLPYHGYIDLDINIFSGHKLIVYGVYDPLSGTLQYMIYRQRDGKRMLVNTVICKIAVDIPITLQTKNDRDSAIFQNVSNTVGGLIGAVGGVASGNPIGAMIGINAGLNAFNSSNASAPLNVKGTVGETGAMYAPHKCSIILRSPTIQGSDSDDKKSTWLKHVGRATSHGYYLGSDDMKGSGLTVCTNPRITFENSTPLQTEVDEIYSYLEKGVIL